MVLICFNMVVFRPSKLDLTKTCFKKNVPKFLGKSSKNEEVFVGVTLFKKVAWNKNVLRKGAPKKSMIHRNSQKLFLTVYLILYLFF